MNKQKQERWSTKRNDLKNLAIVQLKKAGWSEYAISQLLTPLYEDMDKRNVRKVAIRDKEKFSKVSPEEIEKLAILNNLNKTNVQTS